MNLSSHLYSLALFAHIVGVLGLFVSMGLQWAITLRLRRSGSMEQVREWIGIVGGASRFGLASGALLLAAGIYMMAAAWGMTSWLAVSFAAILLMLALGMGVTARRMRAIQRAAAVGGHASEVIPSAIQRQLRDPALWIAVQMASSTALGVVFLMTTKPGFVGSLLAVAVALLLGAVVGIVSARPRSDSSTAEVPTLPVKETSLS